MFLELLLGATLNLSSFGLSKGNTILLTWNILLAIENSFIFYSILTKPQFLLYLYSFISLKKDFDWDVTAQCFYASKIKQLMNSLYPISADLSSSLLFLKKS